MCGGGSAIEILNPMTPVTKTNEAILSENQASAVNAIVDPVANSIKAATDPDASDIDKALAILDPAGQTQKTIEKAYTAETGKESPMPTNPVRKYMEDTQSKSNKEEAFMAEQEAELQRLQDEINKPLDLPAPTPIPTEGDNIYPTTTESQRAKRIAGLKRGMLSTIKTTPMGTLGAGPELNTPAGKMFTSADKKTLGS